MICCYILFSEKLGGYYTGISQENLEERIVKHNTHFYGTDKYSAQTSDWTLFHFIECDSFAMAVRIERHIKKMKSKKYILNLKIFPAIVEGLIEKYK